MANNELKPQRFTKKPVTIDAIQWTGANLRDVICFTDGPPDVRHDHAAMKWEEYNDLVARDGLKIFTLEGKMSAAVGDWIIKGVKGEHYPCKPDVFEMTYGPEVAAPAEQPLNLAAERVRFEAWFKPKWPLVMARSKTDPHGDSADLVETSWVAWEASAAAQARGGESDALPALPERDGDWADASEDAPKQGDAHRMMLAVGFVSAWDSATGVHTYTGYIEDAERALAARPAPVAATPAPSMEQMIELMRAAKNVAPNLTTIKPIPLTPIQVAWIFGKVSPAAPAAPIAEVTAVAGGVTEEDFARITGAGYALVPLAFLDWAHRNCGVKSKADALADHEIDVKGTSDGRVE